MSTLPSLCSTDSMYQSVPQVQSHLMLKIQEVILPQLPPPVLTPLTHPYVACFHWPHLQPPLLSNMLPYSFDQIQSIRNKFWLCPMHAVQGLILGRHILYFGAVSQVLHCLLCKLLPLTTSIVRWSIIHTHMSTSALSHIALPFTSYLIKQVHIHMLFPLEPS